MIEGVFISPEAGAHMVDVSAGAEVIAGRGIVDDRYCKRQGTYSVFRDSNRAPGKKREPGRQLTLVAAEGIEEAFLINGIKQLDSLGDFRRNVVLRGVKPADLQGAVGREIKLGSECVVFVHRWCVPCMYNERKNLRDGLMEATWEVGGVCCEVRNGGTIKAGDPVTISPTAEPERVDAGAAQTDPGFLVRPSLRTRAMVTDSKSRKQLALQHLLKVDPGGVVRGLEAYQSVGLQMFPPLRGKRGRRRGEAMEKRFGWMVGIFLVLIAFMSLVQRVKTWKENRPLVLRPWLPELVCDVFPPGVC